MIISTKISKRLQKRRGKMTRIHQGDILWLNFSPSVGKEMRGNHPALVVSSDDYNTKTSYIIVCPITSHGNDFAGYISLNGYKIHGRINATQIHSFSLERIESKIVDKIRPEDLLTVKQILDYALEIN